ncbi:MAG: AAA family ATPase [Candidatus Nanohaloarchaeota archaeon QJJ-5]|nr:AAA family ATPase [Candidatus Nanohaloarchaeota archaeon QJJ-5]
MDEWMNKRGWEHNPFNFKIYPDLMVGYDDAIQQVSEAISADNKFSIIVGETGAGKTNLLKWLVESHEDEREIYYMPKPPTNNEDLLDFLRDEILQPGFIQRFRHSYTLYNIHESLQDELDEPTVLIIDEAHEASMDVMQWIRTALDHVDNLSIVAAGLPVFKETLQEDVNTLYSRATSIVELESLNRDESIELVRERIEKAGGSGLEPFTQDALLEIYDRTEGFPREVLRACNDCVVHAAREGKSIIDKDEVKDLVDRIQPDETDEGAEEDDEENETSIVASLNLTDKQEQVAAALEEEGPMSSGDVVDRLELEEEYSSRSHAVRSVNNILKRLMENDIVDRDREGRSYVYYLEDGSE